MRTNEWTTRTAGRALLAVALLATASAGAQTAPSYTIEDLGVLPGEDRSDALAISNDGQVLGYSIADAAGIVPRAVLWQSGSATPIDLATRVGRQVGTTESGDINDAGHLTTLAGFVSPNAYEGATAHFWNGTALTNIGKIGSVASFSGASSVGRAINNRDEVVGRSAVPQQPASAGSTNQPFFWKDGVLTQLALPTGCSGGTAYDINDSGQIAGSVFGGGACGNSSLAAVWSSATALPVTINEVLAAAGVTADVRLASSLNDSGAVLAQGRVNGRSHCLLFTPSPSPSMVDIGHVGSPEPDTCLPGGINNQGEVVATQYQVGSNRALLYSNGVLYDLTTLLDAASRTSWQLLSANAINDVGTIVGQGRINGQLRAYRATRVGASTGSITIDDSIAPFDDRNLPFGTVTIGVGTIGTVTVRNGRSTPAAIDITTLPAAPFGIADPQDCRLTLAPGTSCTVTVTFDPTATPAVTGSFTLSLAGTPEVVNLSGGGRLPVLTITDSIAPVDDRIVAFGGAVLVGSDGTATVTVRNTDTTPATVVLTRDLPSNVPFRLQNSAACNTTLARDQSCSLVVIFEPTASGNYSSTFAVGPDAANEQVVTVTGSPGLPNADFQVTQAVDRTSLQPGVAGSDLAILTLTLRNNGPATASARVTDVLPAGLLFQRATASVGAYDSATGAWLAGPLEVGATATLAIEAQATASASGCILTTATAAAVSPAVDPTPGNDRAEFYLGAPDCADLQIGLVGLSDEFLLSPFSVNRITVTHEVDVRNAGPVAATGVKLTVIYYTLDGLATLPGVPSGNTDIPVGDLAPGETRSVQIASYVVDKGGRDLGVTYSIELKSPQGSSDPVPTNNLLTGGYVVARSSESGEGSSGCFIATAAYGSYLDAEVMELRRFRDRVLLRTAAGRTFVGWYYRASPPLADWIRHRAWARALARTLLTPVVLGVKYPVGSGLVLALLCVGLIQRRRFTRVR